MQNYGYQFENHRRIRRCQWQVDAAVNLIDEGNTIPFISRYRKEATGQLNDEQLRKLYERLTYLRNLEEKKAQVIKALKNKA